jgi:4-amino-4-deoxy-L-arabinose transferase-like glycosyltransferase
VIVPDGESVDAPPRRVPVAQLAVAAIAAIAVLVATRHDPLLSPDSLTYLSAAERVRSGDGVVDFTGQSLTHFPPVFPLLLAPGGRSLLWASIVEAAAAAAVAAMLYGILATRVRVSIAFAGSLVVALSQATIYFEAAIWSETPYLALALATISVLGQRQLTPHRAAAAGVLAGLGFLTRYVGAGLVVTGLVMVLASARDAGPRRTRRNAIAFLSPPAALASIWIARNLVATGEPLGPHFEGGAGASARSLVRQVTLALGQLVTDVDAATSLTRALGYAVVSGLVICATIALASRPRNPFDVGMLAFAAMSIVVPVASNVVAGTDVSARLLSPTLIPIVYATAVVVDRWAHHRVMVGVASVVAAASLTTGVTAVVDAPDRLAGSSGNPNLYSPELLGLVADLPGDANILTNNPQRVWWHTARFPVWFAFTQPKPGNSHFPLSLDDTLRAACDADAYLAWFSGLSNAKGRSPAELRPDLAEHISLTVIDEVSGGTLYALRPADPTSC